MDFTPENGTSIYYAILVAIIASVIGYFIIRRRSVFLGWVVLLVSTIGIERISTDDNPIIRMIAIILVMFIGMKIVSTCNTLKDTKHQITFPQWLAFNFGWAGMKVNIFETLGGEKIEGGFSMVLGGIVRIAVGAVLIFTAHLIYDSTLDPTIIKILVPVFLLVAYSLILHFGILTIQAGIWRGFGVRSYYIFNSPIKSISLSVFWSTRWNLAFSEMTSASVYRPLKNAVGTIPALFLSFLFSGLLHEMAISVPVKNGYGLPMLYFIIQAIAILLENFLLARKANFLKNKVWSKLWIWFWVIVPAPILFHWEFIKEILLPLAGLG